MFKRMHLTPSGSALRTHSVGTPWRKANHLIASLLLAASCALALPVAGRAQTFTTVHTFTGGADGGAPYAGLMQADDDNLYGTTTSGGSSGLGTIFQVAQNGTLNTLHSFVGGSDGGTSWAALIQASDGNLYGTTVSYGVHGAGTVFQITTAGAHTTLYSFGSDPSGTDGGFPYSGLVQALNGTLYGTTAHGGTNGNGTIYQIASGGAYSWLYSFSALIDTQNTSGNYYSNADGSQPWASLIQAADGSLYGTAAEGGTTMHDYGTAFKITTAGVLTPLHSFSGGADGGRPIAGMVQAKDGNFYGVCDVGGVNSGGTIYKITAGGTFTILHSFGKKDGINPVAALVQATDGNLYGTTALGGSHQCGTVFRITTAGVFTTIYNFSALDRNYHNSDGECPKGLNQTSDGKLYGTTVLGGANGAGTVFCLSLGLPPK